MCQVVRYMYVRIGWCVMFVVAVVVVVVVAVIVGGGGNDSRSSVSRCSW